MNYLLKIILNEPRIKERQKEFICYDRDPKNSKKCENNQDYH